MNVLLLLESGTIPDPKVPNLAMVRERTFGTPKSLKCPPLLLQHWGSITSWLASSSHHIIF